MKKGHNTKTKEGAQDQKEDGPQDQNDEGAQDQNEEDQHEEDHDEQDQNKEDQSEEDENEEDENEEGSCGCAHPSVQSPGQFVVNLPVLCSVLLQLCGHERHRLQVVTPVVQGFSFTGSHLMQQSLALGAEGTSSGEIQAPQEQQVLHLGL